MSFKKFVSIIAKRTVRKVSKNIRKFNTMLMNNAVSRVITSAVILLILTVVFTGIFINTDVEASNGTDKVVCLEVAPIPQETLSITVVDASLNNVVDTSLNNVTKTVSGNNNSTEYQNRKYLDVTLTSEVQEYVDRYIEKYGNVVDREVVFSLMYTESRFNPKAENSGSHCSGIMQLNPKYFTDEIERFGYEDIFDLEGNIEVGVWYLSKLVKEHPDDLMYALTCYHRGGAGAYYYYLAYNDYDAYAYEVYNRYVVFTTK